MKKWYVPVLGLCIAACGANDSVIPSDPTGPMTFFVTSAKSTTGNVGGLRGADAICQQLAEAAGAGGRSWRAYLSAEHDPANGGAPVDARSRIGIGPWRNANGVLVARNIGELHSRTGEASLFVDETGRRINGQWPGSPSPVAGRSCRTAFAVARPGTPGVVEPEADWPPYSPQRLVGHERGTPHGV